MLSWKTWICASTLSLWSTSRSQPKEGSWRQMTLLADSPAFVMNPRGLCVFLVLPEVLGESSPSEDLSACDLFCKGSLRTCNSTARSCLQKGKEWRIYVSGKRRERTKFFAFLSIQLGKKKKNAWGHPEAHRSPRTATGRPGNGCVWWNHVWFQ